MQSSIFINNNKMTKTTLYKLLADKSITKTYAQNHHQNNLLYTLECLRITSKVNKTEKSDADKWEGRWGIRSKRLLNNLKIWACSR